MASGSSASPPRSSERRGGGGGLSSAAAPKVHALSPTGLSVALVLGSSMLSEDNAPDADLELDAPFSHSKFTRQKSLLERAESRALARSASFQSGVSSVSTGDRARRTGLAFDDAASDVDADRLALIHSGSPPRNRITPATAIGGSMGSGRAGSAAGSSPRAGAQFLTLEEYAEMERAALRRRTGQ